jgi:hypothetical protein
LITKNMILRLCHPKKIIQRKTCTEIGASSMGSAFF